MFLNERVPVLTSEDALWTLKKRILLQKLRQKLEAPVCWHEHLLLLLSLYEHRNVHYLCVHHWLCYRQCRMSVDHGLIFHQLLILKPVPKLLDWV